MTRVFKSDGAAVVLLGDNSGELGGSEYLSVMFDRVAGRPPAIDLARERALQQLIVALVRARLVQSAHDCADGGLAVTLAECTFDSGGIGVTASLDGSDGVPMAFRAAATLFGESASRIVVSVDPASVDEVMRRAAASGVPSRVLGRTGGSEIRLDVDGDAVVRLPVAEAERVWATAIETRMQRVAGAA
jgi:phosphoribosylformylglycinamidine synthase